MTIIGNMRLLTPNRGDTATLTSATSGTDTLPVANLQDTTRERVWRTANAAGTKTVYGDLADIRTLSGFALARHNLTGIATLRLRLYSQPAQAGTLLYDSGDLIDTSVAHGWGDPNYGWGLFPWGSATIDTPVPIFAHWFGPINACASFRLDITDASNADGYIQAARLVIGDYFEPAKNCSYPMRMGQRESSVQVRTEGGSLRTDSGQVWRQWSTALDMLTDSERSDLFDRLRRMGMSGDAVISVFPGAGGAIERDHCGLVKLTADADISATAYANWAIPLTFEDS